MKKQVIKKILIDFQYEDIEAEQAKILEYERMLAKINMELMSENEDDEDLSYTIVSGLKLKEEVAAKWRKKYTLSQLVLSEYINKKGLDHELMQTIADKYKATVSLEPLRDIGFLIYINKKNDNDK